MDGKGQRSQEDEQPGERTAFTCPNCGGVIRWEKSGKTARCEIFGHKFSADELPRLHGEAIERALGIALRLLEEHSAMLRVVAEAREERGEHEAAAELLGKAGQVQADADLLWSVFERLGDESPD